MKQYLLRLLVLFVAFLPKQVWAQEHYDNLSNAYSSIPSNSDRHKTPHRTGEVVDEHGVITTPAEGTTKIYTRSGVSLYSNSSNDYAIEQVEQEGNIEVVETEDGTVYFKDFISRVNVGNYVKGTREGNTITVPAKQIIYYISSSSYGLYISLTVNNGSNYEKVEGDIVLTVDGDVITLQNTGNPEEGGTFVGTFWTDDNTFSGYGDYSSVFTYVPTFSSPREITIVDGDWSASSATTPNGWTFTEAVSGKEQFKRGTDANFEGGYRRGVWRGYTAAPTSKLVQTLNVVPAGVYEYRAQAYAGNEGKNGKGGAQDEAMWKIIYNTEGEVIDTIFNGNSEVKLFFGPEGTPDSTRVKSPYFGHSIAENREANLYMPQWYSVYYVKTSDEEENVEFGMDSYGQAQNGSNGANAYGFGSNHVFYLGSYEDYLADIKTDLNHNITHVEANLGEINSIARLRLQKFLNYAKAAVYKDNLNDIANTRWALLQAMEDCNIANVPFERVYHELAITTAGNGASSYGGTEVRNTTSTFQVAQGSTIKIAVKADIGHRPDQVLVNGNVEQVVNDTLTITNISDDTNVSISFAQSSTTLTIIAEGEGTVSVDSTNVRNDSQTLPVIAGTSPMLNVQPDAHHRVDSLTVNGVSRLADLQDNGTLLLDSVTTPTTVYAHFTQIYHTFTLITSGDGIHQGFITYNGAQVVNAENQYRILDGQTINLHIHAYPGYHIVSVTMNGEDIAGQLDADGNYIIDNMTEDVTVIATFGQTFHTLSITTTGNGAATYLGNDIRNTTTIFSVAEWANAKIAILPDVNNHVEQIMINGMSAQVTGDTLAITITDSTSVFVAFAQSSTTLTIIAEGEGTVTVDSTNVRNDSQTVPIIAGTRPMLSVQPDAHHRVDSLTVNGVSRLADLQGNGALLLDSVTTATTVFVRFAQIHYTLTLNASTHGTITYIDSYGDSIHVTGSVQVFQVAEGASIPLRIKAIANYHMGSITLNGENIADQLDENGNYMIESMVEDVDVRASFCLDETVTTFSSPSFTVTLNPNGGTAHYFTNYYRLGNGGSLTLRGKSNVNKIVNVKMNLQDPARSGNDVMVSSGTLVGDSIIDVNDTTLTITARGSWPQLWLSSLTVTYEGTAPLGTYAIRLPQYQTNGTVTSSHDWADEGDEVTLTATPNEGYHLSHLYANRGAVTISPSDAAINQYTFTMPAEDVTIGAVFAEGDITTGLQLNVPEDAETSATPIYNLQGQRLKRLQRGINIVGGRKQVLN